jgi:hypothetical protein
LRCDWRNPDRDNGHVRCANEATHQITRYVDASAFVAWRCLAHVPREEPRIGTLVVAPLCEDPPVRLHAKRRSRDT